MKNIIIDGSNVVRMVLPPVNGRFDYQEESFVADNLMKVAESLTHEDDARVEVHFDGPKRYIYRPEGAVDVSFSGKQKNGKGKKADDIIVNSVFDLTQYPQTEVIVVTQDGELSERCRRYGAITISAREFVCRFKDLFYKGLATC